ncbi:MAG TPA: DUF484 family protein [Paenalcaligenes sp.]|nr:DUF484 family protein [Paenalcaligenes sp.]
MTQKTYDRQAILEFLAQNPDFLLEQGDALYQLKLPSSNDNRVISFIERQVERLQQENKKTQEQLYTLISNAQRSETIRQQTHQWACRLILHPEWANDPKAMAAALAKTFGVDEARLLNTSELPAPIQQNYSGPITEAPLDFGLPEHLHSMAYTALKHPQDDRPMGALIVASSALSHFSADMATDFLEHIAGLCAAALSNAS